MHLDYPLAADHVPAAFDDELTDIDPIARKWFQKYYSPTLQKPEDKWKAHLASLKENSAKRVSQNKNFQLFLKDIKKEIKAMERSSLVLTICRWTKLSMLLKT